MSNRWALYRMAGGLVLGLVTANAASAVECRQWLRLDADQKQAEIDGMIGQMLESQRLRQYDVHRGAIARCLGEQAYQMELDIDDVCSDSRTADMQAIRRVFKNYVWSCN